MQIGMIGLGRMGGNMVRRLIRGGHSVVVNDRTADKVRACAAAEGATAAVTNEELVQKLSAPRAIWIMLPAEVVENTRARYAEALEEEVLRPLPLVAHVPLPPWRASYGTACSHVEDHQSIHVVVVDQAGL